MKNFILIIGLLFTIDNCFAQKVDSLRLLQDVNGGSVQFTTIAANAVTWGNGYGTNNMAFINSLRNYTLPITLISFKANREANSVKLSWITSSESNSDYFEILKSTDGKNFSAIGVIKANVNSDKKLTYSFKDLSPSSGANYYQLNMVDLDGYSIKSIVVSANFDIEKADLKIYTDVVNGTITLDIFTNKQKRGVLDIFDISGKKLLNKSLTLQSGSNNLNFKLNTDAKMIIVQLNCEGDKQVKKLYF